MIAGGHGGGHGGDRGGDRGRGRGFRHFASSLWKEITCSKVLPVTRQQQEIRRHFELQGVRQQRRQEFQEQREQRQREDIEDDNEENDEDDPLMWSNDLRRHSCGLFSHAMVQSNTNMQTFSQVEVGSNGIFVGIYDGHNSHHAAEYLSKNLMTHLIANIVQRRKLDSPILNNAIQTTEERFLSHVKRAQKRDRRIVISGSSCLVGVIWKNEFLVANIGSSACIKGRTNNNNHNREEVLPLSITDEHIIDVEYIRQRVQNEYQHDPNFMVQCRDGKWRIKGVTQIYRSIGDAYLKNAEIKVHRSLRNFKLSSRLIEPGLSSQPFQRSRLIQATDRFYIFATGGFWNIVGNHKAINMVNSKPRQGIAKRLLKLAIKRAARRANSTYNEVVQIPLGDRRAIHEDMCVIVVFLDYDRVGVKDSNMQLRSFKGFANVNGSEPSALTQIDAMM